MERASKDSKLSYFSALLIMTNIILVFKQMRRETERAMANLIEERCSILQNEIMRQSKERSESVGQLESELESDFPKLQDCN